MAASYTFTGCWEVGAPPGTVHEVLVDLERYPEWWPQVRAVASLGADDAWVVCRSALPCSLDLRLHAVRRELPVLEVAVAGDLEGSVSFRLTEHRGGTLLDLAQRVTVRGWLARLSGVGRPLLRWNHQRMMADGIAGLCARVG